MTDRAIIKAINGPVVTSSAAGFFVSETVRVGREGLLGEVIAVTESGATVQVYEPTGGLTLGEEIVGEGTPVSLTLGPGILDNIFDGIGRPLRALEEKEGKFIGRGCSVPSLDETVKRPYTITVKPGDELEGGAVFATVPETPSLIHKCMVPPGVKGTVESAVPDGEYTVADVLVTLKTGDGEKIELKAAQKWPIRKRRPVGKYLPPSEPLVTGQRVIDSLFPVAKTAPPSSSSPGFTVMVNGRFTVSSSDGTEHPRPMNLPSFFSRSRSGLPIPSKMLSRIPGPSVRETGTPSPTISSPSVSPPVGS